LNRIIEHNITVEINNSNQTNSVWTYQYLNKNKLFLIGNYSVNEMWTSILLVPFPGERSDGADVSRSCVAVVRPYNTDKW